MHPFQGPWANSWPQGPPASPSLQQMLSIQQILIEHLACAKHGQELMAKLAPRGTSGGQHLGSHILPASQGQAPALPPTSPASFCSISPYHSVMPRTLHALQLLYPSPCCSYYPAAPPPQHPKPAGTTLLLWKAHQDSIFLSPLGSHSPLNTPHPAAYPVLQLSGLVLVPPLDWEHPEGRNPQGDSLLCPQHRLAPGCTQTVQRIKKGMKKGMNFTPGMHSSLWVVLAVLAGGSPCPLLRDRPGPSLQSRPQPRPETYGPPSQHGSAASSCPSPSPSGPAALR